MSKHLVLLGDSIFDNAPYVPPSHAVSDHLASLLPKWDITLLATDGDTTAEMPQQMAKLPTGATHLVLSVGGNNALQCLPQLKTPCRDVMEALAVLTHMRSDFQKAYGDVVSQLLEHDLPLSVCTIYDQVPGLAAELKTALALFNEIILAKAAQHQLPIIDLRHICSDPGDYSSRSPIEPSSLGGRKIASALADMLQSWDNQHHRGRLHVR